VLNGPFYMLYVLHIPRTDNESGRYQSGMLTYNEISIMLNRFKNFFKNDARHDIWIHSPETNTTIVYDRHNLLYIYGYTNEYVHIIEKNGLRNEAVEIPFPHIHHYNAEYDMFESKLINEYQWVRYPLRDEDNE